MKIRPCLLAVFCGLAIDNTHAALQLVENFQEIPTGNLNGQRGWSATLAVVKADPADSNNKVVSFEGADVAGANLPLVIPEGSTATLFFRAYSEADTTSVDWFAGMTDQQVSGVGVFGDYEVQIGYSGSQILDTLRVRDASTGSNEAAGEFLPRTWYKIWAVIDNATDTYEVYIKGGTFEEQTQVTATSTGNTSFIFRNSGAGPEANDLVRFLVKSGTAQLPGPALLDDIYFVEGRDLSDPVPSVNNPPAVTLTEPANAATFTSPASITLRATATDADGSVSKVDFFQGTTLIGTDTTSPFEFTWTNVPAGFYALNAKATDNVGGTRASSSVTITVNPSGTNNFVLLDRFESATLGNLNGQNGWTAANATVITDPTQSNNKVASFSGAGGASLNALLPEGSTGTLFFRAYSVSDTVEIDWCAGLSDMAAAAPGRPYSDFEAQLCIAGAQSADMLKVRDGTANANVDVDEFLPRTWYKIWMVIDNAIDQFKVYLQGGSHAEPTQVVWDEFGYSSFVFRNSAVTAAPNDLLKLLILTTAGSTGQFLLDDVYFDQFGENISDPVGAQPALPTVTLTAPAAGSTFTTPTNITLTADASIASGTISKVDFFAGTNLIGTATASPFTVTWNNVGAGTYSLTAKATDSAGGSQVSAPVSITVNQGATGPLRITEITREASGTIVLHWEGDGPEFQVERATALPNFQPLGSPVSARTFTDTNPPASRAFYRISQTSGGAVECETAVAAGGFINSTFAEQTGAFNVEFEATPATAPLDSVIGLSSGERTAFSGFAALARFNPTGNIDARNGGAYAANNVIPYSANTKYKFRLAIDVPSHTYSVYVTPESGTEQTVATNFAFRTEQNTVTNLNNWAVTVASTTGSNTVCDFKIVEDETCSTAAAAGGFVNTPFASQSGTFTVEFEATPEQAPLDSVIGLSSGERTAFSGFAVLARFNPTGNIDARNGGAYAADNVIPYSANLTYKFRLVIDVAAHTYSVFVTPEGGAEQTVGSNFAFRTEQNTVASLDNWAVTVASTTGVNKVCSFHVR